MNNSNMFGAVSCAKQGYDVNFSVKFKMVTDPETFHRCSHCDNTSNRIALVEILWTIIKDSTGELVKCDQVEKQVNSRIMNILKSGSVVCESCDHIHRITLINELGERNVPGMGYFPLVANKTQDPAEELKLLNANS